MANDFNMDCVRDDVQYGVMDDMTLKDLRKTWKGFLGGQHDVVITDKYRGKRVYAGGKPLIWCTNDDPREEEHLRPADIRWMEGNCVFYNLTFPLFEHI